MHRIAVFVHVDVFHLLSGQRGRLIRRSSLVVLFLEGREHAACRLDLSARGIGALGGRFTCGMGRFGHRLLGRFPGVLRLVHHHGSRGAGGIGQPAFRLYLLRGILHQNGSANDVFLVVHLVLVQRCAHAEAETLNLARGNVARAQQRVGGHAAVHHQREDLAGIAVEFHRAHQAEVGAVVAHDRQANPQHALVQVDAERLARALVGGVVGVAHHDAAVHNVEAVHAHEHVLAVKHERHVRPLHQKAHAAAALRREHEVAHLAHALSGVRVLLRVLRHDHPQALQLFGVVDGHAFRGHFRDIGLFARNGNELGGFLGQVVGDHFGVGGLGHCFPLRVSAILRRRRKGWRAP